MRIGISEFVKRQTRTSDFSYFNGSDEELIKLADDAFAVEFKKGYRDGVGLVSVDPLGFFSALVPITKDVEFETIFEARVEGEKKYKRTIAYGIKEPAKHVDIIVYRKDVLEEGSDNVTGAEWDIVSINARCMDQVAPIPPQTMARNQLADTEDGKGGTKADYSGDMFAKSIMFWNTHMLIRERI